MTAIVQQPPVAEVLGALGPPKAGDAGLLNRELLRWATPLGLGYGGMGLVLALLRSLRQGSNFGDSRRGPDSKRKDNEE